jgi:homoserine dehydrogenase
VLERGPERAQRADLAPDLIKTDGAAVIDDPNVQLVVEVLGREEPAHTLINRALRAGKPVVTANKETLAKHGGTLFPLAAARRVPLLCEASVGGGIPLFAALRQVQTANMITAFRGIINGTTNFILSAMTEQGTSYTDALAEAQRLGYAEPDPTADVEGFDASYKACVLAQVCFGAVIAPETVNRTGITGVTPEQIAEAKAAGEVIKLLAQGTSADGEIALSVAPMHVAASSSLGSTSANYNAIELTGDRVGPVLLVGQGAGPRPTASAILSDIVDAARVILGAPPEPYFVRLGGSR